MADEPADKTNISLESGFPSYIRTQTTVRTMIPIQLIDTEFDNLTSINNRTIVWVSAAVGFLTYGADTFFENIFEANPTPFQMLSLQIGVPVFGTLAMICVILSVFAFRERGKLRRKIEQQTKDISGETMSGG